MSHLPRFLVSLPALTGLVFLFWNSPEEAPAYDNDPPRAIMLTPVAPEIQTADSLASKGAYLTALERYRTIERSIRELPHTDEDARGWANYKVARMLYMSDQSDAANAEYDSVLAKYPGSRWAGLASYDRAHSQAALERYQEALPHFLAATENMIGENAGRLAFRIGHVYYRLKQWDNAVTWYGRSVESFPIIGDYALYTMSKCLLNAGRPDDGIDPLRRLIRDYPHSPYGTEAAQTIATHLIENGHYGDAVDVLESILATNVHTAPSDSAALLAHIGYAHLSAQDSDKALEKFRTVLARFSDTKGASDVIPAFETLKESTDDIWSEEERLWVGMVYLQERQYGKAVQTLANLVASVSDSLVMPQALYYYPRSQYLFRRYTDAEQGFRDFLKRYPEHDLAPDASFHVARSLRARKRFSAALDAYMAFAEAYPASEDAPEALLYVARRLESIGRLSESAEYYLKMAALYPAHDSVSKAYWQAGYNYYRAKRYDNAAATFLGLPERYPRSYLGPKANYWAGKSAEKHGALQQARQNYTNVKERYPNSYYAYRADLRLSILEGATATPVLTGWAGYATPDLQPPPIDVRSLTKSFNVSDSSFIEHPEWIHLKRTEALAEVWLRKESEREADLARFIHSNDPAVLAETARIYFESRLYREGIRAADRLQRLLYQNRDGEADAVPAAFLYPAPFWTQVVKTAAENEMDPLFLLAIMRQESLFDQWISSWAGAHGLMQLMPSTAKETALQMRMRDFSVPRLKEAKVSIAIGSRYMSRLLKRFDGKPELALAGYNGGPTRIARWARQRGTRDIDEFVERISMDETRNFVRLVMDNYASYTSLMGQRPSLTRPPLPSRQEFH